MTLRYTGLTIGSLREGMLMTVPTNWKTSEFGYVTEAAGSEILDTLHRKGITIGSRSRLDHVFHTFSGNNGSFLCHWEKA